jgi:protein TonB
MPHALLLSPDDQAVSSITGVLEEMSVTCERPLDGASAAQKLNSQSFDLVLVDCENLPAAKLIFDVCRRGKNGNNPVPIAIVDGRAGLPTAFRLGAELILTKPVAKDQARTTIRTAVSRVRKDVPVSESVPAPLPAATPEPRATAAAAAVSSQLTNFAEPAPSFVPTPAPAPVSTPAVKTKLHSALDEDEIDDAPVAPKVAPSKPKPPVTPSDDPVLRELEESEMEASNLGASNLEASNLKVSDQKESDPKASELRKAAPTRRAPESALPAFSAYQQKQKPRGSLVGLLILALAAASFYAAWIYEPGFREIAQPQIDRVLALAGMAQTHPQQTQVPAINPAKPPVPLAPATTSAAAPESSADPNQTPSAVPDAAASSAAATAPVAPPTLPVAAVAPSTSKATNTAAPVAIKVEASKPSDSKKDAATAASSSSNAELPGESSAIILSSKGAEKRLAHSVPPKYPAEARSVGADGTVVLKAVVDENGKVEGLRLVEGDAILATAAIQAVKQWRYRPYLRNGKAQPFQTVVIVDFQQRP